MSDKKPISLHVDEPTYREMQELARREGRPVASLIREAMTKYVAETESRSRSIHDIAAHDGGQVLNHGDQWDRSEVFDRMVDSSDEFGSFGSLDE